MTPNHTVWGSPNFKDRRVAFLEFLNTTKLEILNKGNDPTLCSARRIQVIDITLETFGLLESLRAGKFPLNVLLSDHRHIPFNLAGSVPVRLIRNTRGTIWDSFREELKGRLVG
jgi:hypothetical protein